MHTGPGIICAVFAAVVFSAGCLSSIFPDPLPVITVTATPTPIPTTESPVVTVPVAQLALQSSDLPSDYILKDRSDITYLEVNQISHDLGWRAGYAVAYYRINREKYDITELRQTIALYSLANMNTVYNIGNDAVASGGTSATATYELPCPNVGDRTTAYRIASNQSAFTTYTIVFIKKNAYEELTMEGTTTDFETLKGLAQVAADKIR